MKDQPRRFVLIQKKLTPNQRKKLKDKHVAAAKRWAPPIFKSEYKEVQKGDPAYESAPFEESTCGNFAFSTKILK